MISAALARIPVEWNFHLVYLLLAGAAFVGGAFLTLDFKTVTIHQTRTVQISPANMSAAQVAKAWGKPSVSVPGAQVNPQLAGATCFEWQSRRAVLCF